MTRNSTRTIQIKPLTSGNSYSVILQYHPHADSQQDILIEIIGGERTEEAAQEWANNLDHLLAYCTIRISREYDL